MTNMKDYALKYAELGFSVIPIDPRSKRPLIAFANKPALTPEEIDSFWNAHPDANIAVRTTNFFVIDIDRHGENNGFESLKKWDGLKLIEPTLQAKTASGGKHLFYFKREDIQINQMIGFLPGVDIKAHPNNYVLVAPSATDKGQYEWDLEKSKEGLTMVTPSRKLVEAIKRQYNKTRRHTTRSYDYNSYSVGGEKSITVKIVETMLNGFGDEGSRNDRLARFVGMLFNKRVDFDVATAYEVAKIANGNTADPLSERELDTTFESIARKEFQKR